MTEELTWYIGKEAKPLDEPPYRAYFRWMIGKEVIRSADFSKAELTAEILRRRSAGEGTDIFEQALKGL